MSGLGGVKQVSFGMGRTGTAQAFRSRSRDTGDVVSRGVVIKVWGYDHHATVSVTPDQAEEYALAILAKATEARS